MLAAVRGPDRYVEQNGNALHPATPYRVEQSVNLFNYVFFFSILAMSFLEMEL